jgi:hypothetical protein
MDPGLHGNRDDERGDGFLSLQVYDFNKKSLKNDLMRV